MAPSLLSAHQVPAPLPQGLCLYQWYVRWFCSSFKVHRIHQCLLWGQLGPPILHPTCVCEVETGLDSWALVGARGSKGAGALRSPGSEEDPLEDPAALRLRRREGPGTLHLTSGCVSNWRRGLAGSDSLLGSGPRGQGGFGGTGQESLPWVPVRR